MSGLSVVKSYCGHGIGELFHCAPNIPHYARNKAVGVMKARQTSTIEPMINSGVWGDRMWPDGDGKRSAQFEHTLLILLQERSRVLIGNLLFQCNVTVPRIVHESSTRTTKFKISKFHRTVQIRTAKYMT